MIAFSMYATRSLNVGEFMNLLTSSRPYILTQTAGTIQCIAPTNAGPVFNDCHVIVDTLRYISLASSEFSVSPLVQNETLTLWISLGKTNIVGTGVSPRKNPSLLVSNIYIPKTNNTIVMTYQTCKSFFWNSGTVPIEYCRPTWVRCYTPVE